MKVWRLPRERASEREREKVDAQALESSINHSSLSCCSLFLFSNGPMPLRRRGGLCSLAVAERSGKKPRMTTTTTTTNKSEAPMPHLDRGDGENNNGENDDNLHSTPPPPSPPSPPGSCCFGDESPRPGELEAIRSSVKKKKKMMMKKNPMAKAELSSPRRTRASGAPRGAAAAAEAEAETTSEPLNPLPLAPPLTPLQNKKREEEEKKKKKNAPIPSKIPNDARPAPAAERERHRFDPRLPNPGWRPPPSPLSLIEEALFDRPWRLLVACCLLNKTTAGVARPCVREFFSRYPDAAAAAAVEENEEKLEELAALFRPCGCHRKRARAVVRLSREFLSPTWKDPRELFGVGEYAADAYWIFVRGIWHCGAEGEEGEEGVEKKEEERATKKKKSEGNDGGSGNGGGKKAQKPSSSRPPRSSRSSSSPRRSFSWRPRDKDLAKYVDFLVETGGQGCGLEREEF